MVRAEILNCIGMAGAWMPTTLARQALEQRNGLTPIFLEAVQARASATTPLEVRHGRLAAFCLFSWRNTGTVDCFLR